ncbi:unnamed protein product [Rotaria sp. Silwood1]|nr:unnamed protein product [Rotaria sp. Silwood1]
MQCLGSFKKFYFLLCYLNFELVSRKSILRKLRDQILRYELANYYQSKQHRDSIINVIRKMKLQLRNTQMTSNQMDTNSLRTTTITDDSVAVNQLKELHKTINTLSKSTGTLSEDVKF